MARTKRTVRVEDEPAEIRTLPPASQNKRTAEGDVDCRIIKIRKFQKGKLSIPPLPRDWCTLIPIDETRNNAHPTFSSPRTASAKSSLEATTYFSLPPELRQQILYDALNDNIIKFKEDCRIDQISEYEWHGLQWTLLEAKKVCLQMESVFCAVHPRVEEDFKGVLGKFEREVKWMAEVLMEIEEEIGVFPGWRWYTNYSEWRRWM
ncbi:hypothetical protein FKW77_009764 [Venturia effusa]|uniref:Uncharacterized protein n=1 Tax=Venturia effusa TaxID=50376 RepID=A0A517KXE7_9PEZI|nr:hypothetical protein FKW77_009764 [Venturia effusa]